MKKLFYNATIHTMDRGKTAKSLLIEEDRILAVDCDPAAWTEDPDCEKIDLQGRAVLPGFHDSHQHFLCYAIDKEKIDFYNARSVAEMAEMTRRYIRERSIPKGQWVQGGGWNENFFDVKKVPTRQQLDEISPDNPVMFTRACCSTAVANTAALKLAGIFENPPKMSDGEIVLDEKGIPTGLLNERARFYVYNIIPNISKNDVKQLILEYQEDLLKTGLTTVQTDDFKLWDATF
ncbi:MAG: amidohydrolase family protein, partial [Eubacteriales bacterium]|nr:amidohydrolase family protein [Eubacteriales bacterium]